MEIDSSLKRVLYSGLEGKEENGNGKGVGVCFMTSKQKGEDVTCYSRRGEAGFSK